MIPEIIVVYLRNSDPASLHLNHLSSRLDLGVARVIGQVGGMLRCQIELSV